MKIEQLPSGSYRMRKTYKGKVYTVVTDYKPTQKQAMILMSERLQAEVEKRKNQTFESSALYYIKVNDAILSPTTKRSYKSFINSTLSKDFLKTNLYDIDQITVQTEINRIAKKLKPKTVRNVHGFISAVLGLYRPSINLTTTLPQKIKYIPYVPSEDEIRLILKEVENTKYHIPFQLGILGLRRSEVCALTLEDIDGNMLMIDKAFLQNEQQKFEIVERNKTTEGKRSIYIPDSLVNEIQAAGKICEVAPGTLLENLHKVQDKLKIPRFRFHDLRHFYATYAHEQGMSDADIMASGGWKSDYTMKSIYRHSMEKSKIEKQKQIANSIFS